MIGHSVDVRAQEEKCSLCGQQATHKISEEYPDLSITTDRHPFTHFVCCNCFGKIFGPAAKAWCYPILDAEGWADVAKTVERYQELLGGVSTNTEQ